MKKPFTIFTFVFLLLNVFLLGAYTASVRFECKEVTTSQWVFASIFSLCFLLSLIVSLRNEREEHKINERVSRMLDNLL